MLCPVCKNISLQEKEMLINLKGFNCSECNGNWLRAKDFDEWQSNTETSPLVVNGIEPLLTEFHEKKASLCPDCGHILIKFNVSSNLPFSIDHCSSCNGIWFDHYEWESLIKNNLYKQLNEIFTPEWQKKIRNEMTAQHFEEHYKKKFGEEDYMKLKDIRKWVYDNKLKGEMLVYLTDKDPYKI